MASKEAKAPDDSTNWQAIDIFLFSNGQQSSPPRKYHLRIDELTWWRNTLKKLAKAQYGSLHSSVELYTLEGEKVFGPLQISNGASYVAVTPPDIFVDAGYDKYLIKATRSWEKRQAKRNGSLMDIGTDDLKVQSETIHIDDNSEEITTKARDGSLLLKTIISSVVENESSVIVKPQPITTGQRTVPENSLPIKLVDKRRLSVQRPSISKKIVPIAPPPSNIKPSYKRKDSIRPANVKITRPESDKNSTCSSNLTSTKLSAKSKIYKPINRTKECPISVALPKVHEVVNEVKTSSTKMSTQNDRSLPTESIKVANVIEDKKIVMVSNLNKIPCRETAVDSHEKIQEAQSIKTHLLGENVPAVNYKNSAYRTMNSENINKYAKFVGNTIPQDMASDKLLNKQYEKYKTEVNTNGEIKNGSPVTKEILKTENSSPNDANAYKLPDVANKNCQIVHLNVNSKTKVTSKGNKSIKAQELNSPKILFLTVVILDGRYVDHKIKEHMHNKANIPVNNETDKIHEITVRMYTTVTNQLAEVQYVKPKVDENGRHHDLTPSIATEKLSNDRYVALLNEGGVVNLKLNIEIQNDSNQNNYIGNTQLATTMQRKDKGSQTNIVHETIAEKWSLIALIAKEIEKHRKESNHNFLIGECNGCKHCANQNAPADDVPVLDVQEIKEYAILIPLEKCEENLVERLYTDNEVHDTRNSIVNPVKEAVSCMSLQTLTKLNLSEFQTNFVSHRVESIKVTPNSNEDILKNKTSEKAFLTKKSVVIHAECVSNCPERIEINAVTSAIKVTKRESVKILNSNTSRSKFTQTEWCDILLEARVENYGHYTFRLPSLETLKYHNLV